ncbi:MAG: hypothetical protein HWE33_15325 [Rhodobacteraceae bacterium]|uniref:hypothetical protein n=1 Tax=Celeribacter sp. HF31 TaxID=2721558 RepID=UPI001431F07A|nr:hypothetical protein [Celeribacter sp. HF31]NIY80421.1 hypothetical protein [Celeribacter sp. HF31]NVK47666.1 hypothetical protein [Paracoccaceae bacterium]
MKQVMTLYGVVLAAAGMAVAALGLEQALLLAYGAIALMALMISATFLWLWQVRATPLALGMSLSWAGSGLTIGWWWAMQIAQSPVWGMEAAMLFLFLSLLIAGAVLHFSVIQGSFGLSGLSFLWPVLGALLVSFGVLLLL